MKFTDKQQSAIIKINEVINIANIINLDLAKIIYDPNSNLINPFIYTSTSACQHLPIIYFNGRYEFVLKFDLNNITISRPYAINYATDIIQLAKICGMLNSLYKSHRQMIQLHHRKTNKSPFYKL